MEVIPSYPYHAAGVMQDGGASHPGQGGTRMASKRRRIDPAGEDEVAGTDTYPQWDENSHERQPYQGTGEVSSFNSTAVVDFSNQPPARESVNPAEGSQWQQTTQASSYPDLGSFQQQPYFYQNNDPSSYNTTQWTGSTSNAVTFNSQDQTDAMPFFPPSTSAVTESNDTLDTTVSTAFQYSEIEPAAQYAFNQPALTPQQIREAATKPSTFYFDDASMHLKIQSLPILDNLATQLIHTISKATFPQIQDLMTGSDAEDSQAYKTLKNLFDQTRKVYSRETPFIDAIAIQMFQPAQQEIIRKANIATFISSILGAHDVSFFHLNEFFMETFVPLGHRLLKWQGAIYLELKTQTYISALINSDGSPEAMLDELFPPDLDAQILTRHPDAPSLSPSEQDFIDRSRARKSYLLAEPATEESVKELPKKYQWTDFVREFASCITKNVEGIMNVPARAQAGLGGSQSGKGSSGMQDSAGGLGLGGVGQNSSLSGAVGRSLNSKSTSGRDSQANGDQRKNSQAASTIRQPWTKPEEDALLAGLERVNGPHWSQILALYGRGGSVSEVLKDRNQVQLKDKARNLKLWYLKTGKEVPSSLRGVTGELRKRGGARARAAMGIIDEDDASGGAEKEGEGDYGDSEGVDPSLDRDKDKRNAKKKPIKKK